MIRAIQSLLNRSIEDPAGCGFLSAREIDAWIEGEVPEPRRHEFQGHSHQCAPCALLAADLEVFHGVAARGILESEQREFDETSALLKAQLRQKIEQAAQRQRENSPRAIWNYALGIAGAAALVAVVAVPYVLRDPAAAAVPTVVLSDGTSISVQPLPFPDRGAVVRNETVTVDDLWKEADEAYESESYTRAEAVLAMIVKRLPNDHDALLQWGSALVMLGRYDDALPVLESACGYADELGLRGDRDFYMLGVTLHNLGQTDRAIEAFQRSADGGGDHGTLSSEILAGLDN
ncbi:MAG: tetratricopeptide repeat protein [bacterium]|nr:tetratricopeptide repeat protein [bacterium]